MIRPDRLSALVSRFALDVTAGSEADANLAICRAPPSDRPDRIVFTPAEPLPPCAAPTRVFVASVRWGGPDNPLVSALPARIELDIRHDEAMQNLAALIVSEHEERRCGSGAVVDRLGEVLLVRLLRRQLERGAATSGLLAGLADARLSLAIVAMHEHPGRPWRVEQLAGVAGLSSSRFAERFARTVGRTPMSYLRDWRMALAREDVRRGERVQRVAERYGYASGEALSRAFRRRFGTSPRKTRF